MLPNRRSISLPIAVVVAACHTHGNSNQASSTGWARWFGFRVIQMLWKDYGVETLP